MYRNPVWNLFLSFIFLGISIYTVRTGYQLWQYMRLDKQTSAQHIQWSVAALSDEEFKPFARYRFHANDSSYQGETLWHEPYLNPSTAQEAILHLSNFPPLVWYNSSTPDISSLQKNFPLKDSLYTLLLWILGFYFLGIGYYVKKGF